MAGPRTPTPPAPPPPIPLLTLLKSLFHKLLEQTQGSLVDRHGDVLLQGLQEGGQGHGSLRAVRLLRRLVFDMHGGPGGDEHRAGVGQRQSGPQQLVFMEQVPKPLLPRITRK